MYRPTFFVTSAIVGGEWSASRPGCFIPRGKSSRYPFDRRLGEPRAPKKNGVSKLHGFRAQITVIFIAPPVTTPIPSTGFR
jgi:hypothetical protein